MRLKLFHAPDMAEAMARVRATLGADALILSTRQLADGVEVTAALEQDDLPAPLETSPALPTPRPATARPTSVKNGAATAGADLPRPTWPSVDQRRPGRPPAGRPGAAIPHATTPNTPEPRQQEARPHEARPPAAPPRGIAADFARQLLLRYHGIPAALHALLARGDLAEGLGRAVGFAPLPFDHPLLLAGPPGAGKTLTIARLATRLVLAGERPLVITADGQRAGATEQLAAFTRLLEIDLIVADTPALMVRALRRRAIDAPALIDCFGIDPLEGAASAAVRELAQAAAARLVGVLPAGMDPEEAADLAAALHSLGAQHLIVTRLDLARRLGSVITAAAAGLQFAEAGIGPGAADGLVPATPALLAERLARTGQSP